MGMLFKSSVAALAVVSAVGVSSPTQAGGTLRIAMTATDVPTTTGAPDNAYEGLRFLGYPTFEGLVNWDLGQTQRPVGIVPGLALSWAQAAENKNKWTFKLRPGVKFHDGSTFNADAVVWNFERYFNDKSPQFDPQGSVATQRRIGSILESWRKVDDETIELTTKRPVSYFPILLAYVAFSSPAQFAKTGSWAEFAKAPSGTGPFKITELRPRVSVTLVRNPDYWDKARVPKLDRLVLMPIPDANARVAALRSGQVDWIEAPPPDVVPSLKAAGFTITTGSYPHVWSWLLNLGKANSPWADIRVRHAINYCADRDSLVKLLNGTAEPAIGIFKQSDPRFGNPKNKYSYDVKRAQQLMTEAGYSASKPLKLRVSISNSGSGQMMPLPMNEVIQQTLKQCFFDVSFDVVEWGTLITIMRTPTTAPAMAKVDAINVSLPPESDISTMAIFTRPSALPPAGLSWTGWKSERYDADFQKIEESTDPAEILALTKDAHEEFVDTAPWAFFVHDLNPRAMTSKVKGFIGAQSWFMDFSQLTMD
jgi:ABC-type transport system substrate-binding protein